jgi:hypothetical protein
LVEVEFWGQGDGECLRVGLHCRSDDFGLSGLGKQGLGLGALPVFAR